MYYEGTFSIKNRIKIPKFNPFYGITHGLTPKKVYKL